MPCSFNGNGQLPLMLGTITGDTSGQDFAPLGYIATEFAAIFIIDCFDFIYTKGTYFPSALAPAFAFNAQNPSSSLKWKVFFACTA